MAETTKKRAIPDDWWVCACVKRDASGTMTHLKAHAPERKKCGRCGCTKEQHDKLKGS